MHDKVDKLKIPENVFYTSNDYDYYSTNKKMESVGSIGKGSFYSYNDHIIYHVNIQITSNLATSRTTW